MFYMLQQVLLSLHVFHVGLYSTPDKQISTPSPGGRYTLLLSGPQWALLSKLEVLSSAGVEVVKQGDGAVSCSLSQEQYSTFLASVSAAKPARTTSVAITDISVEVGAGKTTLLALLRSSNYCTPGP